MNSPLRAERDMDPEVKSRSVYVSALSWNTSDEQLRDHMKQAGDVVNAVVLRRERSHRSLGCGVVEYRTRAMALHAVQTMNDTSLDGRMIHCREDRDTTEVHILVERYVMYHRQRLPKLREIKPLPASALRMTQMTRLSTPPKCMSAISPGQPQKM